jgi:hypothetical protein
MSKQAILDKVMAKAISRKLFTFLTATGLMLWSDLSSDTWGMIAMVYIGTDDDLVNSCIILKKDLGLV